MAPRVWLTLIAVDELRDRLASPDVVVVDCRFDLAVPAAGELVYDQAHLPGAVYAHLERDLSGPRSPGSGRHPLPAAAELVARLAAWGIGAETQVVAYDAGPGSFAARLWWLLRWLGHSRVAVLDGGLAAWSTAGYTLSRECPSPDPAELELAPDPASTVTAEFLVGNLEHRRALVVDARAEARFQGEVEPIDRVAGHVPGARNVPFEHNLGADGRFLEAPALRRAWATWLGEWPPASVIHMCGSGVTACHNLLAMEHAGLQGSRLYPGSWSEWIGDPSRPVTRGED